MARGEPLVAGKEQDQEISRAAEGGSDQTIIRESH